MAESADFDDAGAIAVSIGSTSLVGTGLAKESGGNLQSQTGLLNGTSAGALLGSAGNTVAKEVAAMIAGGSITAPPGGTPLLHGHNRLFTVTGQVLAVGGSFTPANILFTKCSYVVRITAQMSGINSAVPSVKVHFQWRSSISGAADLDEQTWYVPAGGNSAQRTNFKGPVIGDTLNITFTNGDAVNTCTINVDIYEATFPATRHDGRSQSNVGLAGATALNDDNTSLIVGNDSFTAAGSSTTIKTLPLYAGQVNIWINQNVAGGSQVSIVPTGNFGNAVSNPIASLDWTLGPHQLVSAVLPRAWCTAQFTNNAAGGQIATIGITALEIAS